MRPFGMHDKKVSKKKKDPAGEFLQGFLLQIFQRIIVLVICIVIRQLSIPVYLGMDNDPDCSEDLKDNDNLDDRKDHASLTA